MADKATLSSTPNIDSILHEDRKFECPAHFAEKAHVKTLDEYESLYQESVEQPGKILGKHRGRAALVQAVGQGPGVECALGEVVRRAARSISPTTASTATCRPGARTKPPFIWEGEPGEVRTLTYQQLCIAKSQKFANVLKSLGVKKGDRVAIYMGMTPELAHRDAGLRPHRRAAHHRLRRILLACAGRSHPRFASRRRDHAGRLVPARRRSEIFPSGRRGAEVLSQR